MWASCTVMPSELPGKSAVWPAAVALKGLATVHAGSGLTAAGKGATCPTLLLCCVSEGAAVFAGLLLDVHHDRGCRSGL